MNTRRSQPDSSEERFHLVVEAAPNAMVMVDQTRKIILVNVQTEKLFGYPRNELIGKEIEMLVPSRFRPKHPNFVHDFFQEPTTRPMGAGRDLFGLKRDGTEVPIEIGLNPIKTDAGNFVLASIINITKRKEDERMLKEQSKNLFSLNLELIEKNVELKQLHNLKDEFINNVSHELRTPLTIVRESLSQVADGLFGELNERQNKYLDLSLSNIDRLRNIINDLLDMSKIEKGQFQVFKKNVNIVQLIEEVVFDFTPQAQKKGIEIKFNRGPIENIEVLADRDKIIQVLMNLLGNAVKFTNQGFIEISLVENKTDIACCVTDTGIGIPEKDLPRLFSKFDQIARQAGPGEKGTGLGLAIAKNIVELHDGQIVVQSIEGKGSRFTFTLPKYTLERRNIRNLLPCLQETAKKCNCYSLLAFGRKNFDEKFNDILNSLEGEIKRNLYRQFDKIVRDHGFIYVILPDTEKKDTLVVVDRIRRIIDERNWSGQIKISTVSFPLDGLTEEELITKLD